MRIADEQDKMRKKGQYITTRSIDLAFMMDSGDGASWMGQDQRYSVGDRGSDHKKSVRILSWQMRKRRHVDSRKIKDDIEEFGFGGA